MSNATVSGLYIYPVKSLRGIALEESELCPEGLRHDRRWMVVRANGTFVTQRDNGRMALVETALGADGIRLSRPGHGVLDLPFDAPAGPEVRSRVWDDEVIARDLGNAAGRWLTRALESPDALRLVCMQAGFRRSMSHLRDGEGATAHFADAAPYLVANQDSLDALNRALEARGEQAVPMNRFRPNIVVRNLQPFSEHRGAALRGSAWRFRLHTPCERCVVTTIDQATGERHPGRQPFLTLREINPMPGNPRAPAFAQHASLDGGAGERLRIGEAARLQ